jgi:radical SAM/Cys-rich protein
VETLQVNVGRFCNQTCRHCHVDAGPDRTEIMSRDTARDCVRALARSDIPVLDITGGAPELCPSFRYLVKEARALGRRVIDRCNLTVLNLAAQGGLIEFLAEHQVEIVASLPSVDATATNEQRGSGVFEASMQALRKLNDAGYGRGGRLRLVIASNPAGPVLPCPQDATEAVFRKELCEKHGIRVDAVVTLANLPLSRFLESLLESGEYDRYMSTLVDAFNPCAASSAMCRTMVSVGWDGILFDCDFNQMLDLPVEKSAGRHIRDFDPSHHRGRRVATGRHCFGCTAGRGSSCGGETACG